MLGAKLNYKELQDHLYNSIGVESVFMLMKHDILLKRNLKVIEHSKETNHVGEKLLEIGDKKFTKQELFDLFKEESGELYSIKFRLGNNEGFIVELVFMSGNDMNIKFFDKDIYMKIVDYLHEKYNEQRSKR